MSDSLIRHKLIISGHAECTSFLDFLVWFLFVYNRTIEFMTSTPTPTTLRCSTLFLMMMQISGEVKVNHPSTLKTLVRTPGPVSLLAMSEETRFYQPNADVAARAHIRSHEEYLEKYQRSIDDPDGFWSGIADQFYWKMRTDDKHVENLDCRTGEVNVEWMKGSTTNVCYNMLDRHVKAGRGDKVAFYW